MELLKSFLFIAVYSVAICNSHETKATKRTNVTETEYVSVKPIYETVKHNERNATKIPEQKENLDNRIYLKKNKIISETTDVCFTLPKGLPTVPNVLNNNKYERLVVYIYDFKAEDGIKKVIHIPGKNKQNVLPDMPYEASDIMMDVNNINNMNDIFLNKNQVIQERNEGTTKQTPQEYDILRKRVPLPITPSRDFAQAKILNSTLGQSDFYPVNLPNYNPEPSPTFDQFNLNFNIPDMNLNQFKSEFVPNEYIPNYPFPQPVKYENTVEPIELPTPVETPVYHPSNPVPNNQEAGQVQQNLFNLQILQQPMLIKLLIETGVPFQSLGPNFNSENMILVPVIERVISPGKQTFYLNSIGVATKNPLKVYTIVPIRNKIVLFEIHSHTPASQNSMQNPTYSDMVYPYQPISSNRMLEMAADPPMSQVPEAHFISQMPQTQSVPQRSSIPEIPHQIPEIHQEQSVPDMPQIPSIPEISQIHSISHISELPIQNAHNIEEEATLNAPRRGISELFQILNAPMRIFGESTVERTTKTPIVPKMDTRRPRPCKECGKTNIHVVPRILGGNPAVVSGRPIRNRGRS